MKRKPSSRVIFVCSGAADVGELTDRAARQVRAQGLASMSCLASIGARDADILCTAEFAGCVLLIDGCPQACARRTFEHAGLSRFTQFDLSEVGLRKGDSPVTAENIERVATRAVELLDANLALDAPVTALRP